MDAEKEWSWDRKKNRAFSNKKRKNTKNKLLTKKELIAIGDSAYLDGDNQKASVYYCKALEKQENWIQEPHPFFNDVPWTHSYLTEQLKLTENIDKSCASYYLKRASIFFLLNEWRNGCVTLEKGIENCKDASEIKSTLDDLRATGILID